MFMSAELFKKTQTQLFYVLLNIIKTIMFGRLLAEFVIKENIKLKVILK